MLQTLARPNASPASPMRAAMQSYGRVSVEARVSGATPHQLVAMLYQRLAALLREAHDAARLGNSARRLRATERALGIVDGLDTTLDLERGGSVAVALQQVYALLRTRLVEGTPQGLSEALHSVEEIGAAWAEISAPR
jgi:flagellar protein FliS